RALVAEELLLALPDGRVLECESARAAEGGVQGGGEEARHGEVLRSFRVAGRFAARGDWQADLGDFEREVDRDVRTIALDDQGGAGADGEARRPVGKQGGRQARRHKASAVNFPSMTRRYLANLMVLSKPTIAGHQRPLPRQSNSLGLVGQALLEKGPNRPIHAKRRLGPALSRCRRRPRTNGQRNRRCSFSLGRDCQQRYCVQYVVTRASLWRLEIRRPATQSVEYTICTKTSPLKKPLPQVASRSANGLLAAISSAGLPAVFSFCTRSRAKTSMSRNDLGVVAGQGQRIAAVTSISGGWTMAVFISRKSRFPESIRREEMGL